MRDLTAAAGARIGLEVVLVLERRRGSPRSGNLALDGLLGARVVWAGDVREPELENAVDTVVAECRDRGAASDHSLRWLERPRRARIRRRRAGAACPGSRHAHRG